MKGALSRPLSEIGDHYTAVVVGSGYGAGVAASRLARAHQSVCLLERGAEIRPGSYPNALTDARKNFQISTSRGRIGPPDAMFELHVNDDMFALVGCGLGGTSLINANVALEIDDGLIQTEGWPAAFRADPNLLKPYYERAREMLDPSPYPEGDGDYPVLAKTSALHKAAKAMKREKSFYLPPIAVNFKDKTNPFGVVQRKCTNCGDCCSGCNVGAKNTTLMNYLPDAANHGAEIYTCVHVDWLERDNNRWRVHFTRIDDKSSGSVTADYVVLGAGSLGSTGILLRSARKGLNLSRRLGRSFSGNGDVLAFGYDAYWKTAKTEDNQIKVDPLHGVGIGANRRPRSDNPGPCIAGIIDLRKNDGETPSLVIEEGVPPGAIATALPPAFFFADAMAGNFTRFGLDEAKSRLMDAKTLGESFQKDPGSIGTWAYRGPVACTESFLVMSVDSAKGKLVLDRDRVAIDWKDAGNDPAIVNDNEQVSKACDGISAQFFPNPIWTEPLGRKVITVHPVGGCGMGDDATSGVVDNRCRVFSGEEGTDVHPGLYVCDGAAMPGPVGVNPLLTITAVAERAMELLIEEAKWNIDYSIGKDGPFPWFRRMTDSLEKIVEAVEKGIVDEAQGLVWKLAREVIRVFPDQTSPRFEFTETMHGFVSTTDQRFHAPKAERISDDYVVAASWGRDLKQTCDFRLTIRSEDLNALTTAPEHSASISGTVTCPSLAKDPMKVLEGEFRLLTVAEDVPESWRMTYDMVLDRNGNPVRFRGYKVLQQRAGSDPWTDLTTLFVTVYDGKDGSGALLAQGILTLDIEDLMWQASSAKFDPHQGGFLGALIRLLPDAAANAIAIAFIARFAAFFGITVFQAYGGMLATLNNFPAKECPPGSPPLRVLKAPKPEKFTVKTEDRFKIGLTRYCGGAKGPVVLAPGFSVRASSFATPTVRENLVEYLVKKQYDVWLFDYRASADSGNPTRKVRPFTIDDIARYDWPAAIAKIQEVTGRETVQAMAHCVGSMSLLMGLASGSVTGVSSMIASQLTLHPVTDWMNYMKSDLDMARLMSRFGKVGEYFDFSSGGSEADHTIDAIAYNLPVPPGQACKNPTCRRVFGVYGPSYDHAQLSHDTHVALAGMFSRVSTAPFEQLQLIMQQGRAVRADGQNTYLTDEGAANLKLPITFLVGLNNQIFYPESSQRTLAWLEMYNGPARYRQLALPEYAHMDLFIGKDSARKVFPHIVHELRRLDKLASQPM